MLPAWLLRPVRDGNSLSLFGTRPENAIYRHWSRAFAYTEGVSYVADRCQAHWLLDAIAAWQPYPQVKDDPMLQEIQFWKLQVNPDRTAQLR